jgi:alpha-N-arabinofuranosidase
VEARGFPALALRGATTLHHANLKAGNTAGAPDTVQPAALSSVAVSGARVTAELPPASWNLLQFGPD